MFTKFASKVLAVFIAMLMAVSSVPFELVLDVAAVDNTELIVTANPASHTFALETNARDLQPIGINLTNSSTRYSAEYLEAHFESTGTPGGAFAFEILRGFSPGPYGTPYNPHNQIPPNVTGEIPIVNMRVGVRPDLPVGVHTDVLIITHLPFGETDREELLRIPLTANITQHAGIHVSTAHRSINFGIIEVGFEHATMVNLANSAGPRQINLNNTATLQTPVYFGAPIPPQTSRAQFVFEDAYGTSPFIIHRDIHDGVSATFSAGAPIDHSPPGNASNIRIAVRPGLGIGHHYDYLFIDSPFVSFTNGTTSSGRVGQFVRLEVTVIDRQDDVLNLPATLTNPFRFPDRQQGYALFTGSVLLATTYNPASDAPRQFNFFNPSARYYQGLRAEFRHGDSFELIRDGANIFRFGTGTGSGATANRWLNYAPPNNTVNLRVRPVVGLEPGMHTDTLYIFTANSPNPINQIDLEFYVTPPTSTYENFPVWVRATSFPAAPSATNFLLEHMPADPNEIPTSNPLVFPTRRMGYRAFTAGTTTAGSSTRYSNRTVFITNLRTDMSVENLTVTWASVNNGANPDTTPFVLTRGITFAPSHLGVTPAANGFNVTRIEANAIAGNRAGATVNVQVMPRLGLVTGVHTDILQFRGDRGFAVDVPVRFTVTGEPAGISISPSTHFFPSRVQGYSFPVAGGFQEFIVTNNTNYAQTEVMVEWASTGTTHSDIFHLNRDFTRNTAANFHGSSAVWRLLNSHLLSRIDYPNRLGVRIWPRVGLPEGVHSDVMLVMARYQNCTAIDPNDWQFVQIASARLYFEVLAPEEGIEIAPSMDITFEPRIVGYTLPGRAGSAARPFGWIEIVLRNTGTTRLNGLQATIDRPDLFQIVRNYGANQNLVVNAITGTLRVSPVEGLLPGTHTATLTITATRDSTGVPERWDIPLSFTVYEPDISVRVYGVDYPDDRAFPEHRHTSFEWFPRYYGRPRTTSSATIWPLNEEIVGNTLRQIEVLFTNNTGARIELDPTTHAEAHAQNLFRYSNGEPNRRFRVFSPLSNRTIQTPHSNHRSAGVTTIMPGETVGIRILPESYLPTGMNHAVFTLRDENGIPLASIDLYNEIMYRDTMFVTPMNQSYPRWMAQPYAAGTHNGTNITHVNWSPPPAFGVARTTNPFVTVYSGTRHPQAIQNAPYNVQLPVFDMESLNLGYLPPSPTMFALHAPSGYLTHPFWNDMDTDMSLVVPSGATHIYFHGGPNGFGWTDPNYMVGTRRGDSQFFTIVDMRDTSFASGYRHVVSIVPVPGLPVGIYEDVLVIRSRAAGTESFIIHVPIRFEVLPHDVYVTATDASRLQQLPPQAGDTPGTMRYSYTFPYMPRNYSVIPAHAANFFIWNRGASAVSGINFEFVYGANYFGIMDPPGWRGTGVQPNVSQGLTLRPQPNYLGLSVWPRNMLTPLEYPAVYEGLIRITDGDQLVIYISLSFRVDPHDVSHPDDVVFDSVFVGYDIPATAPWIWQYIEITSLETLEHNRIHSIIMRYVDESPAFTLGNVIRVLSPSNTEPWDGILNAGDTIGIPVGLDLSYNNLTASPRTFEDILRISHGRTSLVNLTEPELVRTSNVSFTVHPVLADVTALGVTTHAPNALVEIPLERENVNIQNIPIQITNRSELPFSNVTTVFFEMGANSPFTITSPLSTTNILQGASASISVRPRDGLVAGMHYDYLVLRGALGFELRIRVTFGMFDFDVVTVDYNGTARARLIDPEWLSDTLFTTRSHNDIPPLHRIVGYTDVNTQPFLITIASPEGALSLRVRLDNNTNNAFSIFGGEGNVFGVTRTRMITPDHSYLTVIPRDGLPVGTHTADLVFYTAHYGDLRTIPLEFVVFARQYHDFDSSEGDFGSRALNYPEVTPQSIMVENTGLADVRSMVASVRATGTTVSDAFELYDVISSTIVNGTIRGAGTVEMSVRPRTGLPIGIHTGELVITGNTFPGNQTVTFVVPLIFEVTEVEAPELDPLLPIETIVGNTGETLPMPINVTSSPRGIFTFRWQTSTSPTGPWTDLPESSNILNVPICTVGRTYRRVIVTDTWTEMGETRYVYSTSNSAHVLVYTAQTPIIDPHPASVTLTVVRPDGTHTLNVGATVSDGGELTFQWQRQNSDGTWQNIAYTTVNSNTSTVNVPINVVGIENYRVRVTNTITDGIRTASAYAISNIAIVEVNEYVNAQAPVINEQPLDYGYYPIAQQVILNIYQPNGTYPLHVAASVSDNGVLSFQWQRQNSDNTWSNIDLTYDLDYSYTTNSNDSTLNVPLHVVGVNNYRVIVTNFLAGATGETNANTTSLIATVTVINLAPVIDPTTPECYTTNQQPTGSYHTLTVTVDPPERGNHVFQWQIAVPVLDANGDEISVTWQNITGATNSTFNAPTDEYGIFRYRVIVSNTWTDVLNRTSPYSTSRVAYVRVLPLIPYLVVIEPNTQPVEVMQQAESRNFTARVYNQLTNALGEHFSLYTDQSIVWSIESAQPLANSVNPATGTTVSTNGVVQIAPDQPTGFLRLRATSFADSTVYAYVIIEVITQRVEPSIIITEVLVNTIPITTLLSLGTFNVYAPITHNVVLTADVVGYPAPTIQWQVFYDFAWRNVQDVASITSSGETTTELTLSNVTLAMSGLTFRVQATNNTGIGADNIVTNPSQNQALLIIHTPPTITGDDYIELVEGYAQVTVPFTITGIPTPNVSISGQPPEVTWNSATNSLVIAPGLTETPVNSPHIITITVTNSVGYVEHEFRIYVIQEIPAEAPVILTQTLTVPPVPPGLLVELEVTVQNLTDGGTLSFQWYRANGIADGMPDATPFAPITTPTTSLTGLTIVADTNLPTGSVRRYQLVITNTLSPTNYTTTTTLPIIVIVWEDPPALGATLELEPELDYEPYEPDLDLDEEAKEPEDEPESDSGEEAKEPEDEPELESEMDEEDDSESETEMDEDDDDLESDSESEIEDDDDLESETDDDPVTDDDNPESETANESATDDDNPESETANEPVTDDDNPESETDDEPVTDSNSETSGDTPESEVENKQDLE